MDQVVYYLLDFQRSIEATLNSLNQHAENKKKQGGYNWKLRLAKNHFAFRLHFSFLAFARI